MLKTKVKYVLQKFLGFDNFLFLFSIFTITRLRLHLYERGFMHFLKMIPRDGYVLDIGANIGIMSVPLAKRISTGKVLSFEPMPQNIKALKRIRDYYQLVNVEILETALGTEQGELTMIMPEMHHVKFQGFSHVVQAEQEPEAGERFTVPVNRLDDIPSIRNLPKISALKIDVENFEYQVFQGAMELLLRHKPIIYCEIWKNEKRSRTINFLRKNFGYRVKVFEKNKLVDYADQPTSNFFFV